MRIAAVGNELDPQLEVVMSGSQQEIAAPMTDCPACHLDLLQLRHRRVAQLSMLRFQRVRIPQLGFQPLSLLNQAAVLAGIVDP